MRPPHFHVTLAPAVQALNDAHDRLATAVAHLESLNVELERQKESLNKAHDNVAYGEMIVAAAEQTLNALEAHQARLR